MKRKLKEINKNVDKKQNEVKVKENERGINEKL